MSENLSKYAELDASRKVRVLFSGLVPVTVNIPIPPKGFKAVPLSFDKLSRYDVNEWEEFRKRYVK